jgi:hypothetical protein
MEIVQVVLALNPLLSRYTAGFEVEQSSPRKNSARQSLKRGFRVPNRICAILCRSVLAAITLKTNVQSQLSNMRRGAQGITNRSADSLRHLNRPFIVVPAICVVHGNDGNNAPSCEDGKSETSGDSCVSRDSGALKVWWCGYARHPFWSLGQVDAAGDASGWA